MQMQTQRKMLENGISKKVLGFDVCLYSRLDKFLQCRCTFALTGKPKTDVVKRGTRNKELRLNQK